MTTHYDQEMVAIVETALDYMLSARGQKELQKHMRESQKFCDKLRKMREVSWEKLHAPFTI